MDDVLSVEISDGRQELLHVFSASKLVEGRFLGNSVEEFATCAKSTNGELDKI